MSQIRDNEVELVDSKVLNTPQKSSHVNGPWDFAIPTNKVSDLSTINGKKDSNIHVDKLKFDDVLINPPYAAKTEYVFKERNRFMEDDGCFNKGMIFFNEGAITKAIIAFQAFVQQNPEDSSEGWRMLGMSHQEHDQDREAIICLEKAVEQDPYNLDALLALGVSHVNELNSPKALAKLKAWVSHHPKFQGVKIIEDAYSDGTLMDEVMQLMLKAREVDPNDVDVRVVLGVLYNVSRDYGSAIQEFRSALALKPKDYTLWNKLGATQANGNRNEEALHSYRRALDFKPKYARAWLNMGISNANLRKYEGALHGYIRALQLNSSATHVWSYMRIACVCMERFDMIQLIDQKDLQAFFKYTKLEHS